MSPAQSGIMTDERKPRKSVQIFSIWSLIVTAAF